eukprot:CAMPEP_0203636542 /NCGR_PEP_ID=MMETSP0088-20131115/3076_1 /ASSEMBLY_ACC=CAM_ASM_001087 /TAXON_ID=426623 /ORGANISM="Chaetoceros affinis, Strain CCMP159" /LENGTH=214 /DNA_ID=CAMNT_0050490709 /DNA_START=61 /DNA_END=708 /DNA_ORIENTATION=-
MTILRSSSFRSIALAALLMMATTSDAFTVSPRRSSNVMLQMSASPPPPPAEQVKVSEATPASTAAASTTATNLPSQKELAEKAKSQPVPAAATSNMASGAGISISDIRYDGLVPRTEADEYVQITNNSNSPMDVSGYYVYVATSGTQGSTYYFPKGSTIKPNSSIRVYTNEVHMETGGYNYGSGKAIWSNNGGLAVMKDAKGKKIAEYKYKPSA